VANQLTREQLQRLARLGAHARLEELEAERRAILRAFPGLTAQAARQAGNGGHVGAERTGGTATAPAKKRARRRKKMSAEQRKAASERMRKFWADRRKAAEA
jgi:hypothetical protein